VKTEAKTEKYDQFLHAVSFYLTRRCREFEDTKQKFLEQAQKCPADTIAWLGDSLCQTEEAYRALHYAQLHLDNFVPGEKFATRRELLAAIAAEYRNTIILDSTGGSSTSDFSNAAKRHTVRGRAKALRDIEQLLSHEAI
jgi:hypothetical protein